MTLSLGYQPRWAMIAARRHRRNGEGRAAWQVRGGRGLSLQLVLLSLLAFAQAQRDRGASCDQCGLVGEALGEIGVIVRDDIEHGTPRELSMVLGQESVQVG